MRGLARARSAADLAATVVRVERRGAATVGQGRVRASWPPSRRAARPPTEARPAVILSVQKQPGAEHARAHRARSTRALDELERDASRRRRRSRRENFRQADFIQVALDNVMALRDGAILVVVVLFLFLGDLRTTLISVLALPLSLVAGIVVLHLGASINTMTLGGLTIAIGELVDDAIIDVENVLRRLRGERGAARGRATADAGGRVSGVVGGARLDRVRHADHRDGLRCRCFVLPGIEGRLLAPARRGLRAALLGFAGGRAQRHAGAVLLAAGAHGIGAGGGRAEWSGC